MSNSIAERFERLKKEGRCALIPFITAGDPDLETTKAAIAILDRNGADFIELGVPYSDPLADGSVIQAAATRALQRGTRLEDVLDLVKSIAPQTRSPIILFTYYNPILSRGVTTFFQQIAAAGVKGLVIPDLPIDEANDVLEIAQAAGIEVILLIAPTSSPARIAAIAQKSQGFIYLVSVTGVTGTRTEVSSRVEGLIPQIRRITDKAIGIGFGISDAEQARQVRNWDADAVIVGSAFVKRLAQPEGLQAIEQLCCELRSAISPEPAIVS